LEKFAKENGSIVAASLGHDPDDPVNPEDPESISHDVIWMLVMGGRSLHLDRDFRRDIKKLDETLVAPPYNMGLKVKTHSVLGPEHIGDDIKETPYLGERLF